VNDYKKILVAQTIFLGDLILTIPLLRHLQDAYPHASIDVLVAKGMEDLLASHPAVSSVLTFDKDGKDKGWTGITNVVRRLKERGYSLGLILPGSVRTALAVYLAGIPRRIGTNHSTGILLFADTVKFPRELRSSPHARSILFLERIWKALGSKQSFVSSLYTDVVQLNREYNAIHRHLQLLAPLGISVKDELLHPRLFPSETDRKLVDDFLSSFSVRDLVAVAPGSVWPTKRWLPDRYASLVKLLLDQGYSVVLIGGESDSSLCEEVTRTLHSPHILNGCGRFNAVQSAELLRRCRLLVTNDSAPLHLAAAVGTPCVAIFGPTVPEFGFAPWADGHVIIERKALWCRPCTAHGGNRCPIGTHECMTTTSVMDVYNTVRSVLHK
jgi:heptosyltransferase-2